MKVHIWIAIIIINFSIAGCASVRNNISDLLSLVYPMGIDSGVYVSSVDYTDPVLNARKIIINVDINALTANQIASKLIYLNEQNSEEIIDLYLNTNGGEIEDAFIICETDPPPKNCNRG